MSDKHEDPLFDFEKLDVYQLSLAWLDEFFTLCRTLPRESRYAVGDQLIRAGLSISNNLAEGVGKSSVKERARYYGTAINSARECISILIVLRRQACLSDAAYHALRGTGRRITAMIYALQQSLDRQYPATSLLARRS